MRATTSDNPGDDFSCDLTLPDQQAYCIRLACEGSERAKAFALRPDQVGKLGSDSLVKLLGEFNQSNFSQWLSAACCDNVVAIELTSKYADQLKSRASLEAPSHGWMILREEVAVQNNQYRQSIKWVVTSSNMRKLNAVMRHVDPTAVWLSATQIDQLKAIPWKVEGQSVSHQAQAAIRYLLDGTSTVEYLLRSIEDFVENRRKDLLPCLQFVAQHYPAINLVEELLERQYDPQLDKVLEFADLAARRQMLEQAMAFLCSATGFNDLVRLRKYTYKYGELGCDVKYPLRIIDDRVFQALLFRYPGTNARLLASLLPSAFLPLHRKAVINLLLALSKKVALLDDKGLLRPVLLPFVERVMKKHTSNGQLFIVAARCLQTVKGEAQYDELSKKYLIQAYRLGHVELLEELYPGDLPMSEVALQAVRGERLAIRLLVKTVANQWPDWKRARMHLMNIFLSKTAGGCVAADRDYAVLWSEGAEELSDTYEALKKRCAADYTSPYYDPHQDAAADACANRIKYIKFHGMNAGIGGEKFCLMGDSKPINVGYAMERDCYRAMLNEFGYFVRCLHGLDAKTKQDLYLIESELREDIALSSDLHDDKVRDVHRRCLDGEVVSISSGWNGKDQTENHIIRVSFACVRGELLFAVSDKQGSRYKQPGIYFYRMPVGSKLSNLILESNFSRRSISSAEMEEVKFDFRRRLEALFMVGWREPECIGYVRQSAQKGPTCPVASANNAIYVQLILKRMQREVNEHALMPLEILLDGAVKKARVLFKRFRLFSRRRSIQQVLKLNVSDDRAVIAWHDYFNLAYAILACVKSKQDAASLFSHTKVQKDLVGSIMSHVRSKALAKFAVDHEWVSAAGEGLPEQIASHVMSLGVFNASFAVERESVLDVIKESRGACSIVKAS